MGDGFDNGNISNVNVEMKKRSSLPLILGIVGAIVVAGIVIATVLLIKGGSGDEYQEKLDLGKKYLEELNYEQAILAYEEAIKIDPQNRKAYVGLVEVYHEMGEDDKALEVIEKAEDVIENSTDLKVLNRKKKELEEGGPGEDKEDRYEKLIDKGDQYFADGDIEKAINCYEDAIELDNTIHTAYSGLFDVYVEKKEYKSAERIIDSGLREVTGSAGQRELNKCKKRLEEIMNSEPDVKLAENNDPGVTDAPAVTDAPTVTDAPNVPTDEPVVTDEPEPTGQESEISVPEQKTDVLMNIRQIDNSKYPVISAYTDITDRDGNDIDGLKKSDITGRELDTSGGVHYIKISELTKVIGQEQISIGLVLDKSSSMSSSMMNQVRNAVDSLIKTMNFTTGDRMQIISFNNYVYTDQTYTSNASDLRNALYSISTSGATALYDAICAGVRLAYYEEGSKCVIAFTDGEENSSSSTFNDVVEISRNTGIPVYIVGVGDERYDDLYRNLAASCGGAYYSANNNDIETVLSNLYIDLYRDQQDYYVIKYKTANKNDTYNEWNLCLEMSDESAYNGECEKAFYAEADMAGDFSREYYMVDYILPFSSSREVTESDLQNLSLAELRIARNEIYARHGRQFKDPRLNKWFYSKGWYLAINRKYSPDDFDKSHSGELSSTENKNAVFIQKYEERIKSVRDIFPNATYVELSEYDLALDKPTLKMALDQMKKYSSSEILNRNIKKVQEAIDNKDIKY